MTQTIEMHGPKKPRTETLKLVPSQFTERHQAVEVPAVWAEASIVERWFLWWESLTAREIVAILCIGAVALICVGLIVTR